MRADIITKGVTTKIMLDNENISEKYSIAEYSISQEHGEIPRLNLSITLDEISTDIKLSYKKE